MTASDVMERAARIAADLTVFADIGTDLPAPELTQTGASIRLGPIDIQDSQAG